MLRKVEAGPRIFRGGPARNRAVFIISGRWGLGEGEVHREACLADLALCFCAACTRLPQGSDSALRATFGDENLTISGRLGVVFVTCLLLLAARSHSLEDGAARSR